MNTLAELPGAEVLQYGALGLVFMLILLGAAGFSLVWKRLMNRDAVIEKLALEHTRTVEANTKAFSTVERSMNRIVDVLKNRPCLKESTLGED